MRFQPDCTGKKCEPAYYTRVFTCGVFDQSRPDPIDILQVR